jgi:hypothetical protein
MFNFEKTDLRDLLLTTEHIINLNIGYDNELLR